MIVGATTAVVFVLLFAGCFYCRLRHRRKMRTPVTADFATKAPERSQADDATRSVASTVTDEVSPMSRSGSFDGSLQSNLSSCGTRTGVGRSVSLDSAKSSRNQIGVRPLQRNLSTGGFQGGQLPPQHRQLERSTSADGNLLPSTSALNSPRRGRKPPQRTNSAVDPGALSRRPPPQRSATSDGLPICRPAFEQSPKHPMPPHGLPARAPPRRSASADSPSVTPPSATGFPGPTRMPTWVPPKGEPDRPRLPLAARSPPQRTQSARPTSKQPAPLQRMPPSTGPSPPPFPRGLQRIPSIRKNNSHNGGE